MKNKPNLQLTLTCMHSFMLRERVACVWYRELLTFGLTIVAIFETTVRMDFGKKSERLKKL